MYEKQTSFQSGVSAAPQNMQQKNALFCADCRGCPIPELNCWCRSKLTSPKVAKPEPVVSAAETKLLAELQP